MRIGFVTTEYPTERLFAGGLASYLRRTAAMLTAMGHEIEVFTLSDSRGCINDGRVLVHRVRNAGWISGRVGCAPYLWRYGGYARVLESSLRLAIAARRRHLVKRFDVLQAASCLGCGLVAARWGFVPVVTRISAYEPLLREGFGRTPSRNQFQVERCDIAQIRHSISVYAPSELVAGALREREGVACDVVETPFEVADFADALKADTSPPIAKPYGLYFGSISRMKGSDRLVKTLPGLLDRFPDLSFVFVGRPFRDATGRPFDEVIRDDLAEFGARVLVFDALRHEELIPVVRHARFVVLPSRVDNLPNACMEAMAMQRVVIATRDASFEQLIEDGRNGFLVSQQDDNELAERMASVWRMADVRRQAIGEAAQQSLERLRPERTVAQLVHVFETACHRRKRGSLRAAVEPS